jgi:PST family polysaccharide transporter
MPDTGRILLAGVSSTAVGQLDLLALSVTAAKPTVGQYFLANNLSSQVLALLAINLGSVLFPVLAKMSGDPPRQTGAYLRACRALALIGVPLCLGEALLAKPAVRVIFGAKWNDAAALLILLACAAAIKLAGSSAGSLLLAQGRYHANMVWSVINAAVFGTAVFAGACWLSAVGVAAGALAAAILIGPPMVWWAVRPGGGRWRDVASVYVPPVVMSAVSLLPGLSVMLLLKHTVADDVVVMITALVTAPPIYLIIACKFMPAEVAEIAAHLPPLMRVLVGLRLLPTRPVSR